ncbi:MAG: hypothetical protein C4523_04110 [Myxococcales bacterium]|nr:MAG: hypothetical protein C4523_04110 [Myxococcales bacterium]
MFQERFEKVVQFFNTHHPDLLASARKEFFDTTGEVYEEDPFFEERIENYLEWAVLDRPCEGSLRPIDIYERNFGPTLHGDDRETMHALVNRLNSLFEVRKIQPKETSVTLMDLADKTKYLVTERRSLLALQKGHIIQVRLIQRGEKFHFLQAFVHHPEKASAVIRKLMRQYRKEEIEDIVPLLIALQRTWMQCQRYQHVPPSHFYGALSLDKIYG